SLRWSAGLVRELAALAAVLVGEVLPTRSPSDPSYQTRLDGLATMGRGALDMLRGTVVTLRAARSQLDERRQLAQVWSDHAADFARLWTAEQCAELRGSLQEAYAQERDAAIQASLHRLRAGLERCGPTP
nr:hypothetical protein [Deltaproteobacteria bacterium]